GLAQGEYRLDVGAWGVKQGWVLDDPQTRAAGTTRLEVVVGRGLAASGRLLDAAGNPMHGASIVLLHSDGRHTRSTQTGADGRFSVGGLVRGSYTAQVVL